MSFDSLMVHQINTFRLKAGVGIQKTYQKNLINQQCMIQPMSPEYAAKSGMTFGRAYHCYVPLGTDIQMTDKLIDQDNKTYMISGSLKRNYGSVPHLTFLMTEEVAAIPDQ